MSREGFGEAALRVIELLRQYEWLKEAEIVSAFPFLDAPRPLARPTVAVGLRGASARKKEGEIELGLWLYVPETQNGDALTALFSCVCDALLAAEAGVTAVNAGKSVEYSGDLFAFLLPCTALLTLRRKKEEEEAPLLSDIEIRGEVA